MKTYDAHESYYSGWPTLHLKAELSYAEQRYKKLCAEAMEKEKEAEIAIEKSDNACSRVQAISDLIAERELPDPEYCPCCGNRTQ